MHARLLFLRVTALVGLALDSYAVLEAWASEVTTASTQSVNETPLTEVAVDPEATNFPYPFPVRFFPVKVERKEVRIAFMDVLPTQRPNGRTVVLLHGKNFSGAYWEPTIRVLVAEGFRVVVPDQIGFGKSTKPEASQFTFQVLASTTALSWIRSTSIARVSLDTRWEACWRSGQGLPHAYLEACLRDVTLGGGGPPGHWLLPEHEVNAPCET